MCHWALCDEHNNVLQSGSNPLAALPKGYQTVGIINARSVLSLQVKQPAGARRRWISALPFLVEEFCLRAPEENFVVPGNTTADNKINLYVIDKAWLTKLINSCQTVGLTIRKLYSEGFLVNASAQEWIGAWDGSSGWINRGDFQITPLDTQDTNQMPIALHLLLKLNTPNSIKLLSVKNYAEQNISLAEWQEVKPAPQLGDKWDWQRIAIPSHIPNLLVGEFAPRTKFNELLPSLRPLFWLVGLLLAIQAISLNIHWLFLSQEKQQLSQSMEHSFYEAFGSESTLVNAPLQMQRNLARLRHQAGQTDPNDFIPLLDKVASILNKLPENSLQKIQYESGRLNLDIRLPQKQDFAALEQQLREADLSTIMGNQNDTGNGVETRITVSQGVQQ